MKIEMAKTPESVAFCRICHEKSPRRGLITPCNCMGTVSWVHRHCLECWLTQSHRNTCELCGQPYECVQELPGLFVWLKKYPRPVITDFLLCSFLTPLAVVSVILCYKGAINQVEWRNALESLCLFTLGSFLLGVYVAWIGLTIRSHYQAFTEWRVENPLVRVVWPVPHRTAQKTMSTNSQEFVAVGFIPTDDEVFLISSAIPHMLEVTPNTTSSTSPGSSFRSISRNIRLRSGMYTPRPDTTPHQSFP